MYIGQNTLRDASVEFVRKPRTNYARRIVQPFQTRTQPRGSRLRACQNDYFDTLKAPAGYPAGALAMEREMEIGKWQNRMSVRAAAFLMLSAAEPAHEQAAGRDGSAGQKGGSAAFQARTGLKAFFDVFFHKTILL